MCIADIWVAKDTENDENKSNPRVKSQVKWWKGRFPYSLFPQKMVGEVFVYFQLKSFGRWQENLFMGQSVNVRDFRYKNCQKLEVDTDPWRIHETNGIFTYMNGCLLW